MIIIIRGHIRNSFDTDKLYNFIKILYNNYNNLEIYIHTWNILSNSLSWRKIQTNNTHVTNQLIKNYFKDLSFLIKHIIIDDDTKIKLIGNTEGTINGNNMPLIGWKNYWYGKYRIIDYINNLNIDKDTNILNFRFDLFDNSNNFEFNSVIDFINNNINNKLEKNKFFYNFENYGVDNVYIGSIKHMYILIYEFYNNLDYIIKNNTDTPHQEFFVFRVNNLLFNI